MTLNKLIKKIKMFIQIARSTKFHKDEFYKLSNQLSKSFNNSNGKINHLSYQISKTAHNLHKNISKSRESILKNTSEYKITTNSSINNLEYFTLSLLFNSNKKKYYINDKIKVSILFQFPSFYPSIESVYNSMISDSEFDVTVILGDFDIYEKTQTLNARKFLQEKNIPFIEFDYEKFVKNKPHILVLQSPYDDWHRPKYLSGSKLKALGIRIVYITYGIELSDAPISRLRHFQTDTVRNCWKLFTFSENTRRDYFRHSNLDPLTVQALGHPKFDGLLKPDSPKDLLARANKKKILLWKLHFPYSDTENNIFTPNINVYINFADYIIKDESLFYIVMVHPKYYEIAEKQQLYAAHYMLDRLRLYDHIFIHEFDQYQAELMSSDFLIIDRSSVLIESIATQKPILYMFNNESAEILAESIKSIVDSYYSGSSTEDMIGFIDMCKNGYDPKFYDRKKIFNNYAHYFDGNNGHRICEHLKSSLINESDIE